MKKTDSIHPFIRMVKIRKHKKLSGDFSDCDHVLIYLADGNIKYSICGYSYSLTTGDVLLIPPYMRHSVFNPNNESATQYIIHFDFCTDPVRKNIPHKSADYFITPPEVPDCEKILKNQPYTFQLSERTRFEYESMFIQAFREFSEQQPFYHLSLQGILMQMLVMLSRNQKESAALSGSSSIKKNSKSIKLVQLAQEYIWLNYSDNIDNPSIADALGVSPNYLTRVFHQHVGVPLHKYLQTYRLEVSRMMLAEGKYNITETARNCGFSSIHLFSKLFKKEYGLSPSEYMALPVTKIQHTDNNRGYNPQQQTYYN